jgi:fucose permease
MIDAVPIANVGVLALYLLFIWLASAILASYLSQRKGYGEKAGLASGLLLSVLGALAWIFIPAKQGSDWRIVGPFPWQRENG